MTDITPRQFEAITGLSGYDAALVLGVSKSKWYAWSKAADEPGARPLPPYIRDSIEAHVLLHRAGLLAQVVARRRGDRRLRGR